MVRCTFCGKDNHPSNKNCWHCGAWLKAQGLQITVPEAFRTNWSDIAPDSEAAEKDWKENAVPYSRYF
jgi:hypothetical protein